MSWETAGIVEFEGMRSVALGVVGVDACVGEVRGGNDSGDDKLGASGSRMVLGKPGMRLLKGKSSANWGSDVGVDVSVGAIKLSGVGVGAIELSGVGVGAGVTEGDGVRGGMIAIVDIAPLVVVGAVDGFDVGVGAIVGVGVGAIEVIVGAGADGQNFRVY